MPARVLYVGQQVSIDPSNGLSSTSISGIRFLPVQSASCEVNRPIEDILSFGHLGTLGRVQNAVSTCKADIKTYVANFTGIVNTSGYYNAVNADLLNTLTGQALGGTVSQINVTPNGFTMSGILASVGISIALGQFATCDFSFVGVGEPTFASAPSTSSYVEQAAMPTSFQPVTSTFVSGAITGGCANSFKFNLDIPNETINCLGGVVSGSQGAIANQFLYVAKPPFKASVSVEGLAVDPPTAAQIATTKFVIGKLGILLPGGQIVNRSFNNAVGQAGASYNYTIEDVSCLFSSEV
jgi:hypothetical protein